MIDDRAIYLGVYQVCLLTLALYVAGYPGVAYRGAYYATSLLVGYHAPRPKPSR